MPFPFVSRERYEEAMARIADLEAERKKYVDVLAYNAIHMTIFDKELIPKAPDPVPEPELTPEQKAEAERESLEMQENNLLASIRRTRPSLLPRAMEKVMNDRSARAAAAAVPPKVKPAVQEMFDKAKSTITH